MADGALTLTFADDALASLAERAQAVGLTPQALATLMIEEGLADAWRWVGDDPRATQSNAPAADEVVYELNEVMDEFDAELERRLAARS